MPRLLRALPFLGMALACLAQTGAPAIQSFYPAAGRVDTPIMIFGSGFSGTREVHFGNQPAQFQVQDTGVLETWVPPGADSGPLTVTTPTGVALSAGPFQVDPGPPQPATVLALDPVAGPESTRVVLLGQAFTGLAAVTLDDRPCAFQYTGYGFLAVTVPLGARSGPFTLVKDSGAVTVTDAFQVTGPLVAPAIHGFGPEVARPADVVTLVGEGFSAVTEAKVGDWEAAFFASGDTTLYVILPEASAGGQGLISVVSPLGADTTVRPVRVSALPPVVQGIAPEAGPPGTRVVLTGLHLAPDCAVYFGGLRARVLPDPSATRLRVEVPRQARTGPVEVVTAGGGALSEEDFTVVPVPRGD